MKRTELEGDPNTPSYIAASLSMGYALVLLAGAMLMAPPFWDIFTAVGKADGAPVIARVGMVAVKAFFYVFSFASSFAAQTEFRRAATMRIAILLNRSNR